MLSSASTNYIDQINSIRDQISDLQSKQMKGAFIRSKCNFFDFSEKPSKFFFVREKQRSDKKVIKQLVSDGKKLTDNASILNAFKEYYSTLFTEEEIDDDLMNEFLSNLPKLTPAEANFCEGPVSLEEIKTAIESMQCNKSPGSDRWPYKGILSHFH